MPLTRDKVRLKVERSEKTSPVDVLNQTTLIAWRSSALRIELGIFLRGTLESISNLATLTLEIKPQLSGGAPTPATAPEASKTINTFDTTLLQATWDDKTKQHAVVEFTDDEMDIAAGNKWLVIACTLSDDAAQTITLAAGPCEIREDGFDDAGSAPVLDNSAYTKSQSDALYLNVAADGTHAKRGTTDLGSGVSSGTVAFATAFGTAPAQVLCTALAPDGTGAVLAVVVHTITAAGFSFLLSGDTPDASHKLQWLAIA